MVLNAITPLVTSDDNNKLINVHVRMDLIQDFINTFGICVVMKFTQQAVLG
jgi:hypothetical protein